MNVLQLKSGGPLVKEWVNHTFQCHTESSECGFWLWKLTYICLTAKQSARLAACKPSRNFWWLSGLDETSSFETHQIGELRLSRFGVKYVLTMRWIDHSLTSHILSKHTLSSSTALLARVVSKTASRGLLKFILIRYRDPLLIKRFLGPSDLLGTLCSIDCNYLQIAITVMFYVQEKWSPKKWKGKPLIWSGHVTNDFIGQLRYFSTRNHLPFWAV